MKVIRLSSPLFASSNMTEGSRVFNAIDNMSFISDGWMSP